MKKFVLTFFSAFLLFVPELQASDITFAVIGPHEYALPVNYDSFNVFVQYGFWNNDRKRYDDDGDELDKSGDTDTYVGLSKYVRFFTLDSLPNVGLAYEVILPEVRVQGDSLGVSGLGDPITGPAIWYKPTKNSTLGFQTFVQIPIGDDELSNHSWNNLSSFFWDVQLGKLNIDGDAGVVLRSDRRKTGENDIDQGETCHVNLRVGYRTSQMLEPFIGLDWQTTSKDKDTVTGLSVPNSDSNETALGVGLVVNFSEKISFTGRYSKAVDGKNTVLTDALYIKFAYTW